MTMTVEISSSEQMRAIRGSALKKARKASGLSAERLAQFVNDRTAGSDLTRHAIYSYEQGKVLLSREVGHRIATALQLHPGKLLLGDPEYATPAEDTKSLAHPRFAEVPNTETSTQGVAVAVRVELILAAQRTLAPADVLVRLLQKAKLGRIEIVGYLDVFHLLLEDTLPLTRSAAFEEVRTFGDEPGNEAPYALTQAVLQLHAVANATLKRLIDPAHESPTALFEYCQTQTAALAELAKTIHGEINACNKRLPGVSMDEE